VCVCVCESVCVCVCGCELKTFRGVTCDSFAVSSLPVRTGGVGFAPLDIFHGEVEPNSPRHTKRPLFFTAMLLLLLLLLLSSDGKLFAGRLVFSICCRTPFVLPAPGCSTTEVRGQRRSPVTTFLFKPPASLLKEVFHSLFEG